MNIKLFCEEASSSAHNVSVEKNSNTLCIWREKSNIFSRPSKELSEKNPLNEMSANTFRRCAQNQGTQQQEKWINNRSTQTDKDNSWRPI